MSTRNRAAAGKRRAAGPANTVGQIEAVTNGDPLDFPTHVEAAYIDGRIIELSNRQTRLRDKYKWKYRRK